MKTVNRKAVIGIMQTFVVLVPAVFLPGWSLRYWQGWACLLAFFVPASVISAYVAKNDPALLERRLKAGPRAEKETVQKVVQSVTAVVFLADFVVPALDHRFGWSHVPAGISIVSDLVIVLSFLIVFEVFKVNSFSSGVIEVAPEQKVISTGPYSIVRHPMYSGALLMLFAIPVALGSWWGLLGMIPMTVGIIVRLLDEERFLREKLRDYGEYRDTVRWRLVPLVW